MTAALPLFDFYPAAPGFKRDGTSRDAARSMADAAPCLKSQCWSALRDRPMTADECAAAIGVSILAIRPRFSELLREGLIEDTGERRANASGRKAQVMRAR